MRSMQLSVLTLEAFEDELGKLASFKAPPILQGGAQRATQHVVAKPLTKTTFKPTQPKIPGFKPAASIPTARPGFKGHNIDPAKKSPAPPPIR